MSTAIAGLGRMALGRIDQANVQRAAILADFKKVVAELEQPDRLAAATQLLKNECWAKISLTLTENRTGQAIPLDLCSLAVRDNRICLVLLPKADHSRRYYLEPDQLAKERGLALNSPKALEDALSAVLDAFTRSIPDEASRPRRLGGCWR